MAKARWNLASMHLVGQVPRSIERKAPRIQSFAWARATSAPRRLARLTSRQYVQKEGMFDPKRASMGFDNRKSVNRFSGCEDEFDLQQPQMGFYCGGSSSSGVFASIAAEAAFYSLGGKRIYEDLRVQRDTSKARSYFDPKLIFPDAKILVEYEPEVPISAFSLLGNLADLESMLDEELRLITEFMEQIASDAPRHERDRWITPEIERELASKRGGSGKTISILPLLEHPSYFVSAPIGNAILAGGLAVSWPSVRGDVVPQQLFLEGSENLVLPVKAGLETGLSPTYLHYFDPKDRKFVKEPASSSSQILEFHICGGRAVVSERSSFQERAEGAPVSGGELA